MLEDFKQMNAAFPWLFPTFAAIFGTLVGSFLNVCIYRIPAGKSIIRPGSTCACGKPVAWYDNIPVLSWFILRGKARCCGQPYSFRYAFVELLVGALFLGAWLTHPPAEAACIMVFVSMMTCACFIDWDTMEIPDRFSLGAAFVGVMLSMLVPSLHGIHEPDAVVGAVKAFGESVIGILIGSGFVLWLAMTAEKLLNKEAMGFGDVKLLGAIGAFAGWQGAMFALFGGAVLGTIGVALLVVLRAIIPALRKPGQESVFGNRLPFGPMLAAGGALYFLFFEELANFYFDTLLTIIR